MRLGQAKDRTMHKYLEMSSKYSVLVQFKARSEEVIAILSNTITRNHSLQQTHSLRFVLSNLIKNQENPQTTKAHRKEVTWRSVAATLTIEYQAYLILKSNNRTRIAKKRSKS